MNYEASSAALAARLGSFRPKVGLILGSGLGFVADERISDPVYIPYEELPDFPRSTVEGHKGRFVAGMMGETPVLCMQGRFHFYEGYDMAALTLPIRLMSRLGVTDLFLTNAAGGINPTFRPGDLMVIEDHINFLGGNPLRGPNLEEFGVRFSDMTEAWSKDRVDLIKSVGEARGIPLKAGVYLATTGPSFETPAEIRAFRTWGADAVGMSTVPECIVARHCGMTVMGVSCITNAAAGLNDVPLTHEEVAETANKVKDSFADLVEGTVKKLN
jgi:purine-nucleoside phosphorylase